MSYIQQLLYYYKVSYPNISYIISHLYNMIKRSVFFNDKI